jgi:23S rRNA pseudouridine2605 synthase
MDTPEGPRTLIKHLVAAGFGSRRACARLVMEGKVRVNGEVAEAITAVLGPRDVVEVGGASAGGPEHALVYLAVNKPDWVLSAVRDDRGRRTVVDLVPKRLRVPGLVPAGRLDLHSTGLILLTNDGDLVNRLTHPRYGVEKEYHVALDRVLTFSEQRRLLEGVPLPEGETGRAVSVRRLPAPDEPPARTSETEAGRPLLGAHTPRYAIVMREGRKREVRLMLKAVGRTVRLLTRVRMGTLLLGDLEPGAVRELTKAEVAALRGPAPQAPRTAKKPGRPSRKPAGARPAGAGGPPPSRRPRRTAATSAAPAPATRPAPKPSARPASKPAPRRRGEGR